MREIKFRGKCADTGEWLYGLPSYGPDEKTLQYIDDVWAGEFECNFRIIDPKTVGQFTGLKDKNGVEIYEGDLLEKKNGTAYEVYWDKNTAQFAVKVVRAVTANPNNAVLLIGQKTELYRKTDAAVTGNIHDNPL